MSVFMAKEKIKLALIQMCSGENKTRNLQRAEYFVRRAARRHASMAVLPECFIFRGNASLEYLQKNIAETINGPVVQLFQQLAKDLNIFLVLGSFYEKVSGRKKVFNTSVFIDSNGKRIGTYRKKNLFSACLRNQRIREADVFLKGKKSACFQVKEFKVGAAICYDLRFPEIFQQYARKGCGMIVVPSNFTYETGKAHWEVLLRARAIENNCFIVASNQCGIDSRKIRAYGTSMIVDPWGEVVARASIDKEQILYGEIEQKSIIKAKRILS